MLFQTLSVNEAARQLLSDEFADWSYDGAHALADYLDDMWEDCGAPDFGFNVVDVRCEYSEMDSVDLVNAYGYLLGRDLPSDGAWVTNCEEAMEDLRDNIMNLTYCFIELDNGSYIVGDF